MTAPDWVRELLPEHPAKNRYARTQSLVTVREADESSAIDARGDGHALEVSKPHVAPVPKDVSGDTPAETPGKRIVDLDCGVSNASLVSGCSAPTTRRA